MVCPLLCGVVCRVHAQYPAFNPNTHFLLPDLQKWQLGVFVFLYLRSLAGYSPWGCKEQDKIGNKTSRVVAMIK